MAVRRILVVQLRGGPPAWRFRRISLDQVLAVGSAHTSQTLAPPAIPERFSGALSLYNSAADGLRFRSASRYCRIRNAIR